MARKVCGTKLSNNFIFKEKLFYIKRFMLILLICSTAMKLVLQLIINVFFKFYYILIREKPLLKFLDFLNKRTYII